MQGGPGSEQAEESNKESESGSKESTEKSWSFDIPLFVSGQGYTDPLGQKAVLAWSAKVVAPGSDLGPTTVIQSEELSLNLPESLQIDGMEKKITVLMKALTPLHEAAQNIGPIDGVPGVPLTRTCHVDETLKNEKQSKGKQVERLTTELLGLTGAAGAGNAYKGKAEQDAEPDPTQQQEGQQDDDPSARSAMKHLLR